MVEWARGARWPAFTGRRTPTLRRTWSDPLRPLIAPRALVVTPPPASLNVVAMLCTPLTGPPAANIALEGPEAIVGAAVSLSARSTRAIRTDAASDTFSASHDPAHST